MDSGFILPFNSEALLFILVVSQGVGGGKMLENLLDKLSEAAL